jgi:hypothetical protein
VDALKKALALARADLNEINKNMLEQEDELRGEIARLEREVAKLQGKP